MDEKYKLTGTSNSTQSRWNKFEHRIMKSFFITISFSIFLVLPLHASWSDNFLLKTVSTDQLVVRKNLSYTVNSKKPFTGIVQDTHENGQVSLKGKYADGLKTGLFLEYYDNGQLKKSSNFFMGTEEGKIEEFHKNGNIKTSYKLIDGKIRDGLFKLYDEEGYVEKLEFFNNYKSLDYYESHNLIVVETGKNFNIGDFFDDDDNFKIVNVINSKTQKPFSGEYIYINRSDKQKTYWGTMNYNFKNGKLEGKGSEFNDKNLRVYRGDYKNGMEHGFYEYIEYNVKGIKNLIVTGQFYLNKKNGTWVFQENGKKTYEVWRNGIKQN